MISLQKYQGCGALSPACATTSDAFETRLETIANNLLAQAAVSCPSNVAELTQALNTLNFGSLSSAADLCARTILPTWDRFKECGQCAVNKCGPVPPPSTGGGVDSYLECWYKNCGCVEARTSHNWLWLILPILGVLLVTGGLVLWSKHARLPSRPLLE